MLTQPDERVLNALARINQQEPVFMAWLKTHADEIREDAVLQRDEVTVRWAQGRSQELKYLLDNFSNAQAYLRKASASHP